MPRWSLIALFAVAFLAFLAGRAPLSLITVAIDTRAGGLAIARTEGTIWQGRFVGAVANGQPLGDIAVSLAPWRLLTGALVLDWRIDGPGLQGEGRLMRTLGGATQIRDARLTASLRRMPTIVAMDGTAMIEIDEAVFGPSGCRWAAARLWTDALVQSRASLGWAGPPLAGEATCVDGALVLPLSGAEAGDEIDALARLEPDLRFRVEVSISTSDGRLQQVLPLLGFSARGDGFVLVQRGALAPGRQSS